MQVKVTRRSMLPDEWTRLRFGWLKRRIYDRKWEIPSLLIRDARQIGENEYEYYSDDYRPLKPGDLHFTPDGTAFFKAVFTPPEPLRGKELHLLWQTAAEVTVKINGVYVGGVDPNRERISLSPYVDTSGEMTLEAIGYNRSKPDDERNPETLAVRGCRQIFNGAYLVTVNEAVQSLVYDFELLLDILESELFSEDYRSFLSRELSNAMDLIEFGEDSISGVEECGEYIERRIYADKTYRGSGKVALVAHSHLDIAYYWRRLHAIQKNMRTVLIQLRLMDKYPSFCYTHTQPYVYETLEKHYPEIFAELKEKVASGQFEPVGAMYVEPDCNIPSAESLIRQCLYGQKAWKKMFGRYVDNAWLPDVFGNSYILPQILKKSGVDYFVSNKMSTWNDTNRFPHNNFIWRGLDGSEVFACVPPTHFITWNMPSQVVQNWESFIDKDSGAPTLNMFGYGDGGSGCTEEMLELMARFGKLSVMPDCEHVGGAEYLHNAFTEEKRLSVYDGELYLEMHRGTLTTKAELKRRNRKLEYKFRDAELICAINGAGSRKKLTELYKKFLVNQFHDILPGSHIHPVFEDAIVDLDEVESGLDSLLPDDGALFNTLNFRRRGPCFIENEEGSENRLGMRGDWAVIDAEAMGKATMLTPGVKDFVISGYDVSTPFYDVRFSPDGSISRLFDRKLKREWVDGEFNKLHLYSDTPGNYDAWDILPNYKDREYPFEVVSELALTSANEIRAEFSAKLRTENSSWTMIIRLFAESRAIEVEYFVDWREKHRLAKANFDVNVLTRKALCDTSAGFIERETHKNTTIQQAKFEVCAHKWLDLSETDGGVAFINESKYGAGLDGSSVSLSLLRAPIRPDVTSDMGTHRFAYLIYPHEGDAVSAGVNKLALSYNVPPVNTAFEWKLPTFEPLFIQSVKDAEDGSMIVIRLSEQDGKRGRIRLPFKAKVLNMLEEITGETDEICYSPFEIITIGI